MSKAPWTPRLLSIILFSIAVSFPLQIMSLYGHEASEWIAILNKLTIFNLMTMALCTVSAIYLWNCHLKSLYYLGATAVTVAWNNYLVGYVGYDYDMAATISATGMFISSYALLLHPSSVKMLLQQNQRWWLQADRKALRFPTELSNMDGVGISTRTFDLSASGVYVSFEEDTAAKGLNVGEYCNISIQVSEYKKLRCLAKIVRFSEGTGKYPKGVGLRFERFEEEDEKYLAGILDGSKADVVH